jgi:hypothetical protein
MKTELRRRVEMLRDWQTSVTGIECFLIGIGSTL